jgi:hypothetical protein
MDYMLEDAEQMNKEYPDTFEIPTEEERNNLCEGDFAKLVFLSRSGGERMWVEVKGRSEQGIYYGDLGNRPLYSPLDYEDCVEFLPKHVADIWRRIETTNEQSSHNTSM